MVTLAKFRQAQVRMKTRDFTLRYTEKAFSGSGANEMDVIAGAKNQLVYIPIMTNRGSCGALNSNMVKYMDFYFSPKTALLPLGKKGIDSLSKLYPEAFQLGIINDMKEQMHFGYASYVWENAKELTPNCERYQIIFHRCISAASQKQCRYNIPGIEKWKASLADASSTENQKSRYLFANALLNCDDETLVDFYDFHSSLAVLNAVCENELSEQAARLVAVEGQLSNIHSLQLKTSSLYNKTRQSSITSSLIEIISAMTSLEGNATKGVRRTVFWEGEMDI